VGSNNLDTTFSGVIEGFGAGSLTKVGAGTLTLSNANTYDGGTTIRRGKLLVNNTSGSGTGTGGVQVNSGRLGGSGTIAGAVTVGDGSGRSAFLSPGASAADLGTLAIQSALMFNSAATYRFQVNSTTFEKDKVIASGVTINGAQFSFADLGSGTFATGTVFKVIDNTSPSPIVGTFTNLGDGSTFSTNGNTYKANYQGGDGNDLTLRVVP
jgi:autotransporter-associated beta strand protein